MNSLFNEQLINVYHEIVGLYGRGTNVVNLYLPLPL